MIKYLFQPKNRLKIKENSRHYYLGLASFHLKRNNIKEVHANLRIVEMMQADIEELEKELEKQ